ncbi:sorbin and SH3 domain-containing protein 1 isoform X9 [Spodoptera litura]|uniref:Sorbin and SH3 domain-containing protein 1 isoform X9 n=1 Tax=Spodoptera litura TaxID=69820 RepID=A0A9J7ITI3_SPOLT|nr:sorbin and SH3 domain-containing protein 1 isoform X9 [Spodoptera litura]
MTAREVELTGGAPWGFRMHGGTDQNQPLRISRRYSDTVQRNLDVNPGRKASLSGIREGDIISSINGRPTKSMSNADAHAMLRSAGPVLRLGLNEDREVSPRRRSIGKGSELKRPSQLIAEVQGDRATPQAPVYATIRPSQSPQNRPSPSSMRASLNSLPAALNSTSLVKSVVQNEEPLRFHPTNPFFTTLPSNYSSTSKLPVPNGRASIASLDRNKYKDNASNNDFGSDLKSPTFFTQTYDSGPSSLPYSYHNENTNGYNSHTITNTANEKSDFVYRNHVDQIENQSLPNNAQSNNKNPFDTKRNSDPFEKYLRPESKLNGKCEYESKTMSNSISDSNFHSKEEITKRSTISEHKISEVEEVRTIKKIVLNGCDDQLDSGERSLKSESRPMNKSAMNGAESPSTYGKNISLSYNQSGRKERERATPIQERSEYYSTFNQDERDCSSTTRAYESAYEANRSAETKADEVVSKQAVKSPNTPTAPSPKHTVMIAPTFKARSTSPAIWRPGAPPPVAGTPARSPGAPPPPPPPPVWTPGSAGASPQTPRKTFRPVHFEETPPARRKFPNSEQNGATSESESEGRLRTSHSAPVTGLSNLGGSNFGSRLPKAQNPTVTLLQKAREGQISRGSNYIQQERDAARLPRDRPSPPRGDPVHALRKEYASEGEADRSDYERGGIRKMADAQRKVEGIGPITKDGMPVALRSEVKDPSRWYKKMYDTIHKNKYDDDYVTIRYKSRRGQPPERVLSNKSQYAYFDPRSGYLSEPEGGLSRLGSSTWSDAYDSDVTTGPRRRTASVQEDRRFNDVNSQYSSSTNKYSTLASARASQEVYKNQPGRIENYVPGKSSVVDKEAKQWWDEVMDIFDGWLDDNSPLPPYTTLLARAIQKSQNISSTTSLPQSSPKEKKDLTATILSKSNMARALKESGYESDSTLVFRRREDTEAPLSPAERRAAYRDLQAGGEPPLRGFRSPAPPRQENDSAPEPPRRTSHGSYSDTESPRRYVESDVNIHYRCPVRHDPLPLVPERELARQQAEHMKRLYREQKRNKYLQENEIRPADIEAFDASMKELQDMQNRRHQDNFTPSQKNILPLNRYDEAEKVIAKALYTFNGQTARELSFRKGELIHVRRQIDNNWYEGELHGRIGLFPYNYVEIQKGDVVQTPKKPAIVEGRARAKFDFTAQTNLELPLKKGEVVVLTRRIDQNWWEGRNGSKTGIFPDSYVTVLQEPSPNKPDPQPILNSDKPVASPAAHGLLNGSAKRSMGSHSYTPQPNSPALSNAPPATQPLPGYVAKPAQATLTPSERGYGPPTGAGVDLNNTEPLYVDTNAEAIPYRAMYKYRPQNPDELELNEGDTVYVLEKCDDGWYVGSSQRTGRFGTFPGNYVERI